MQSMYGFRAQKQHSMASLLRMESIEDIDLDALATSSPESQSCPHKCLPKVLTNLTFTLSLFSGLSLTLSGLFKTNLGNEELDGGKVQYNSKQVGLIGLMIFAYSIVGICLCCTRGIHKRYKLLCPINMILSLGALFYSLLGDEEGELMLMDMKSENAN